jgi:hypothetical protein
MRAVGGVNEPGNPRTELRWSDLSFDGQTVAITGTAGLRDNAVAFAEALGQLDERRTFTNVDTSWHERALPPSQEMPDGDFAWDFQITATYNPQPAAR